MDHSPRPEDQGRGPGYETRDLALKPILYFVIGLLLFGTTVQFVMAKIMSGVYLPQTEVAAVPRYDDILRDTGNLDRNRPAPLQRDTTKDMLDMYAEEDAILGGYGVDKKDKTNRIPLDRAMAIVAK